MQDENDPRSKKKPAIRKKRRERKPEEEGKAAYLGQQRTFSEL